MTSRTIQRPRLSKQLFYLQSLLSVVGKNATTLATELGWDQDDDPEPMCTYQVSPSQTKAFSANAP